MTKRAPVLVITTLVLFALLPFNARTRPSEAAPSTPVATAPFRLGPSVSLPGTLPHLAAARVVGSLPANRPIAISIGLRLQNATGLAALLHDLYTPGSAQYHHWLTPRQFQKRFAPTAADRQRVVSWMRSHQLQTTANCDNLLVTAVASVAEVGAAFHTHLYLYKVGTRTVFANGAPVQVPQGLAPLIGAVTGLTNAAVPHHLGTLHRAAHDFNNGLKPSELADIYGFTPLYNAGNTGSGVTFALPEVTGINDNNIATFDTTMQLAAPTIKLVPLTIGGKTGGTSINVKEEAEAEMDIEIAHGMAPNASLLVYQAPDSTGLTSIYCRLVQDNKADVFSSSYGLDEKEQMFGGTAEMDMDTQFFQQAAAQGQTVLAASGDNGAYDVPTFDPSTAPLQVDYPASDPYVTGIGGTSLIQSSDGSISETTWGHMDEKAGSGGGLSAHWKRPDWQTGPGVNNQYSNGYRQVPDVAALADADLPGYATYTVDDKGNAGWIPNGGTSAASPLWGAFIAVVDGAVGRRIGFLNPTLYALGSSSNPPFNDITQGNNLYYPATPGWDFATGWGSMKGLELLNALAGAPVYQPPTSTPTPTATATPTPTSTPVPPKKKIKCKKGYKLVKGKCKKVKKK